MFSGFSICTSRHVLSPTRGRVGLKVCHFLGCCFESVFFLLVCFVCVWALQTSFQSRNLFWVQLRHFLNHSVQNFPSAWLWFCCHAGISGLASRRGHLGWWILLVTIDFCCSSWKSLASLGIWFLQGFDNYYYYCVCLFVLVGQSEAVCTLQNLVSQAGEGSAFLWFTVSAGVQSWVTWGSQPGFAARLPGFFQLQACQLEWWEWCHPQRLLSKPFARAWSLSQSFWWRMFHSSWITIFCSLSLLWKMLRMPPLPGLVGNTSIPPPSPGGQSWTILLIAWIEWLRTIICLWTVMMIAFQVQAALWRSWLACTDWVCISGFVWMLHSRMMRRSRTRTWKTCQIWQSFCPHGLPAWLTELSQLSLMERTWWSGEQLYHQMF